MAQPLLKCYTMCGVLRNDTTAQAQRIYIDHYIYTTQLPLLPPPPTTSTTTHRPPRMQSHGPYGRRTSPFPRPPDHLGLPGTAPCCCRFCVRMYVCVLLGMAPKDTPPLVFGRSVVRVCPCRSPNSWALLCVWVPPSAGLRFGRRKITNYKLQITSATPCTLLSLPGTAAYC